MGLFGKSSGGAVAFGKGLATAGRIVSKGSASAGKLYSALDKTGVTSFVPGANVIGGALKVGQAVGDIATDIGTSITN
jgi:hypothetical protein